MTAQPPRLTRTPSPAGVTVKPRQALQALGKLRHVRLRATEEHVSIIIVPMPFILSLDEGTTSARAALYDSEGRNIGMEALPFHSGYPQPGWVEQDAEEIWRAQIEAARRLIERLRIPPKEIAAAGITNQRETTVVWDRATGRPVAPAIVWQCRRTADFCAELARAACAGDIMRRTGLVIDAYFSASKIRWILEHVPGARERARSGDLLFGNIDTWLIWKLTNGRVHATDPTNASRTMLMNLETGDWDDALLATFDVPRAMLPASWLRAASAARRRRSIWAPRSPSRASPATSRRRSPGRPASAAASRKTPTARAVSRCCTPARAGRSRRTACSPRAPLLRARRRSTP